MKASVFEWIILIGGISVFVITFFTPLWLFLFDTGDGWGFLSWQPYMLGLAAVSQFIVGVVISEKIRDMKNETS